jgi:hypothetical protein
MNALKSAYSVYVSTLAVELHMKGHPSLEEGRLICSQSNYNSILRFARNLAEHHHIPFRNYVQIEVQP